VSLFPPQAKKLKILFVTRLLNPKDPVLGFTWSWVKALANHVSRLYVATSYVDNVEDPPSNVHFYTWMKASKHLGGRSTIKRTQLKGLLSYMKIGLFINQILIKLGLNKAIDVVLAHMNPEFVLICAPLCKIFRIPLLLWYLHRQSSLKLVMAHALSDLVVTAHQGGFPIPSPKVRVIGHGIEPQASVNEIGKEDNLILCVGRISRSKRFEEAIKALSLLKGVDAKMIIVGPIYDRDYFLELLKLVENLDLRSKIHFAGPVPHDKIGRLYHRASLLVSCSLTGLDKTVLEAMSAGLPVVVGSRIFNEVLGIYSNLCRYKLGSPEDLAYKMEIMLSSRRLRETIGEYLKRQVALYHSVDSLALRILSVIEELKSSASSNHIVQ